MIYTRREWKEYRYQMIYNSIGTTLDFGLYAIPLLVVWIVYFKRNIQNGHGRQVY